MIAVSSCTLGLVLFSSRLNAAGTRLLQRVAPRKQLSIPHIDFSEGASVIPWVVAMWLLMSFGFYALILSLSPVAPLTSVLAFPFAATVGILAIVAPGGLGVREGILTLSLVGYGLGAVDAASISVFSRLWFLVGEGAYFCTALGLSRRGST